MSKKLSDISLYYPEEEVTEPRKKFTKKANLVTGLYVHFLGCYKPLKTTRVSVHLGSPEINIIGYTGSVLSINYPFDTDSFWELSDEHKNKLLLNITHEVATLCCREFNWEFDVFSSAYQKVLDANFVYEIALKRKQSKNRKLEACLIINKVEGCAITSVGFFNKEGELLNKVEIFRTQPHEMFYGHVLKKYKWIDDHFGITAYDDEVQILANPHSNERTIKFYPNKYSQRQLEKFVNFLTYRGINSKEEYEAWLKE